MDSAPRKRKVASLPPKEDCSANADQPVRYVAEDRYEITVKAYMKMTSANRAEAEDAVDSVAAAPVQSDAKPAETAFRAITPTPRQLRMFHESVGRSFELLAPSIASAIAAADAVWD